VRQTKNVKVLTIKLSISVVIIPVENSENSTLESYAFQLYVIAQEPKKVLNSANKCLTSNPIITVALPIKHINNHADVKKAVSKNEESTDNANEGNELDTRNECTRRRKRLGGE
jgi:hypothetical protein